MKKKEEKCSYSLMHECLGLRTPWSWNPSYQQILWFDVTVDDVEAVQVFDGTGQVVQHPTGISLSVFVSGGDGIEEVSSLRENSRSALTDGPVGPSLERRPTHYKRTEGCTRGFWVPRVFPVTSLSKAQEPYGDSCPLCESQWHFLQSSKEGGEDSLPLNSQLGVGKRSWVSKAQTSGHRVSWWHVLHQLPAEVQIHNPQSPEMRNIPQTTPWTKRSAAQGTSHRHIHNSHHSLDLGLLEWASCLLFQ